MKFSLGDQVSFVNEKGGGTIIGITKNGSYKVSLEDGFDLTVTEKELALVKSAVAEEKKIDSIITGPAEEIKRNLFNTPENEITFIVVPAHENKVLTGDLAFYLSNNTTHNIYFVLSYSKNKNHFLIADAAMAPGEELQTGQFIRQELTDWDHLHIQVLLFQKERYHFMHPVQKDIPLLLPEINMNNQEKGRFGFARQFTVYRFIVEEEFDTDELMEKFAKASNKNPGSVKPLLKKRQDETSNDSLYGIYRNEKEVDLHIDVLVKDKHGLSNADMLQVQLKKFRKEMDHAILNHFHSITFIHGVGEGVLRKALIDELQYYHGVKWRDGAYEKFGAGAIEVVLV